MLFCSAESEEEHRALIVHAKKAEGGDSARQDKSGDKTSQRRHDDGAARYTVGELYDVLQDAGQSDILNTLRSGKVEQALPLFEQLAGFHDKYPGGIGAYVSKARDLLRKAQTGVSSFQGMVPQVPDGETLKFLSDDYVAAERAGVIAAKETAFVMVAGGLGERLGYNGIKISLPVETTSCTSHIEHYIRCIMVLGSGGPDGIPDSCPPFAIMTSDETHLKTLELLEANDYFGYPREKITLLKQDKVPCLASSDAQLATDPKNPYKLLAKPHGHGDVHYLLHTSGTARRWLHQEKKKWVVFFQDTNGLVFHSMCAALGVSVKRDFDANSIAGPRLAKQAMGAIVRLEKSAPSSHGTESITCNVEYNLLDPMLRATSAFPEGDVNVEETGVSPFPGNMNQLIFKLSTYVQTISKSGGVVPEFVNPKYVDESRTSFKKPTRLECMMQDLPRQLPLGSKVGFTTVSGGGDGPDGGKGMDCVRFYSPVKNNVTDAAKKQQTGGSPACASSAEAQVYETMYRLLRGSGVHFLGCSSDSQSSEKRSDEGLEYKERLWMGVRVREYPRVVLPPQCSLTSDWCRQCFQGNLALSQRSTVLVKGKGRVVFKGNVSVDGALVVDTGSREENTVVIEDLNVSNAGWEFQALEGDINSWPEFLQIRGYSILKRKTSTIGLN